MGGSTLAYYLTFISPSSFSVDVSIFLIVMVVMGGAANFWGPLVGSAILVGLPEGAPDYAVSSLLALAALLPCGLAAGLAADLVAGERDRRSLETQFTLSTPFGRLLSGGALSIVLPGAGRHGSP